MDLGQFLVCVYLDSLAHDIPQIAQIMLVNPSYVLVLESIAGV